MLNFKQDFERDLFAVGMKRMDEKYDAARRMVWGYRGKNGYHSKLSDCAVHPISDTFNYAYLLLCRNEEGDVARAHDILYRVIPLQDINPTNRTYGIWQYYLEEDLEEMDEPDWNWADFNGKTMLRCLNEHGDKLSADMKMRLEDAVRHACEAIIRRNVGPAYTNISVMGSYVTIFAGELFNDLHLFTYGKERLRKLHEFNMSHDNFSEFNSPTYTFLCLSDLSLLAHDVKDADCRRMADELIDLAWKTVALHYHTATGQLAGPHDRAYDMMVGDGTRLTLERALNYGVSLIQDREQLQNVNMGVSQNLTAPTLFVDHRVCPEKYCSYFTEPCGERIIDQTFAPGRMAYTYMCNEYTVGSLHHEIAWNQHRNVLGYFGTQASPVAFNLKCLHDGWDYSSAIMSTIQDKGRTLTGFSFATAGGDTHCCLDMIKNATISAEDMRVRWQLEGALDRIDVTQTGETTFRVVDRETGLILNIAYPYAVFGQNVVRYEIVREEGKIGIDAILYHGERTDIKLNELGQAAVITALDVTLDGAEMPAVTVSEGESAVEATCANLYVRTATVPDTRREMGKQMQLKRDGEPYRPAY